jgi:LysR family glycine cleavage system transcriptional activator
MREQDKSPPAATGRMPSLPPLNAVRAFEAAARHVSFAQAAEELNVTRGAISRQVVLLEQWLGRPLFLRSSSQIVLTPAGRNYLLEVSAALRRLAFASRYLDEHAETTVIRLHAPPTFTMRWLITRISTFQRRYPNIEIRPTTYRPEAIIGSNEFDVGIRGSEGPVRGLTSIAFMHERIVPVCHPDLAGPDGRMQLADIGKQTLITYSTETCSWPRWLASVGVPDARPGGMLRFDPMYFAMQAAMEGLGIVLLPLFIVIDDLVAGKLCAPFGMLGEHRLRDYYVNYMETSRISGAIEQFVSWLTKEGCESNLAIADWAASTQRTS